MNFEEYTVYYTDEPQKDLEEWNKKEVPVDETSVLLDPQENDLERDSTYTTVVQPKNEFGEGPPSDLVTFSTGPGYLLY